MDSFLNLYNQLKMIKLIMKMKKRENIEEIKLIAGRAINSLLSLKTSHNESIRLCNSIFFIISKNQKKQNKIYFNLNQFLS